MISFLLCTTAPPPPSPSVTMSAWQDALKDSSTLILNTTAFLNSLIALVKYYDDDLETPKPRATVKTFAIFIIILAVAEYVIQAWIYVWYTKEQRRYNMLTIEEKNRVPVCNKRYVRHVHVLSLFL